MESVAAQGRVVFLDRQLLRLKLLVPRRGVARRGLALLPRLGAFDGDDLAGHSYSFSLGFSSASSSSGSASLRPTASTLPSAPRRRCRRAPSRSNWAWASTLNQVQGIASRRVRGIGLPVNSQTPYVFFSIRLSASSIS